MLRERTRRGHPLGTTGTGKAEGGSHENRVAVGFSQLLPQLCCVTTIPDLRAYNKYWCCSWAQRAEAERWMPRLGCPGLCATPSSLDQHCIQGVSFSWQTAGSQGAKLTRERLCSHRIPTHCTDQSRSRGRCKGHWGRRDACPSWEQLCCHRARGNRCNHFPTGRE